MPRPVRLLFFAALTLACSPTVPADAKNADAPKKWSAGDLAEARKRLLAGNYEEAREAFAEAAKKDAKLAPLAAIGTAQTFREVGEFEKALDTLNAAAKATPENPDVLAARADLLYELGRWDDAEKDADAAIAKKENQLRARWTKARVLRERGSLDDADKAFRWVVRHYTARSNADDDIADPDELLVVALAGAENARWHSLSKQFSFILNEVIGDALKADPDLWPAEFVAGSMLLEKYNRPDAGDAFDKALKINPKAADALVGKGQSAFIKYEFTDAESFADQALKVNPKHPSALRLKADVQIMGGDFPAAEKLLTTARAVNPRDSHTLGRLAAIYLLQRRDKDFDAVVKDVEAFDAKPGVFYFELGHALEERKRYADAEKYLRKAAELRPMLAGPRNGLGLLQLRMGDEKGARASLDKAFETDPFNVRVSNSIKVLKHLDKYETIATPHYELRFDPATDKLLAKFVADYLEETHVELKRQFGYEPPGRVLIEVFSTHEMFSGRTVGLPDLHTIGACTGKVIAMASPTAKGLRKPFNWGRVIRHELTHIFNLAQTDFLCPHWLTEGLAVRNEQMARPPQWVQVLRERANANTLLDLDTITLGFVRPRSPDEWQLAYCQSQLYVEYMVKNHGEESVGKVLDQYKTGVDDATVLKRALGVEKAPGRHRREGPPPPARRRRRRGEGPAPSRPEGQPRRPPVADGRREVPPRREGLRSRRETARTRPGGGPARRGLARTTGPGLQGNEGRRQADVRPRGSGVARPGRTGRPGPAGEGGARGEEARRGGAVRARRPAHRRGECGREGGAAGGAEGPEERRGRGEAAEAIRGLNVTAARLHGVRGSPRGRFFTVQPQGQTLRAAARLQELVEFHLDRPVPRRL